MSKIQAKRYIYHASVLHSPSSGLRTYTYVDHAKNGTVTSSVCMMVSFVLVSYVDEWILRGAGNTGTLPRPNLVMAPARRWRSVDRAVHHIVTDPVLRKGFKGAVRKLSTTDVRDYKFIREKEPKKTPRCARMVPWTVIPRATPCSVSGIKRFKLA